MRVLLSLIAVTALFLAALAGVEYASLHFLFGAVLPYIAIVLFLGGVIYKVVSYARSPVPFRIPTTCGQQKTLRWIKSSYFESPHTLLGVLGRMAMEVLFFRSLFRNTRMEMYPGPKVTYGPTKWLWAAGLLFHYSFLVIFVRHLRFFTEPVPELIKWIEFGDGFLQVGVPVVFATTGVFLAAVTYLFVRRVFIPQVRYVSLINDYFPLFLLLGIGVSGGILRHFVKTDIAGVKQVAMGLLSFNPVAPEHLHYLFYGHLFLVTVLIAYFPFSKLMHMAGVFLSPTRNLANNNRMVRHINPWNAPVDVHSYEHYEDEFREKMKAVDIPVDKE